MSTWRRSNDRWRFLVRSLAGFAAVFVGYAAWAQADGDHLVALFPAASDGRQQGFVRVINHSRRDGEVRIEAFDDDGNRFGPTTLMIDADETMHFNSIDLEEGNLAKGLSGGVGFANGDWRLLLSSSLDIEVLSYIRTPADGFLTSMHDLVPFQEDRVHRVAIFNPGSNRDQESRLRLVNPGDQVAEVAITGIDGNGASPGGEVRLTLEAGESRTISAQELESGGAGFTGTLGDGAGKWQLAIESDRAIHVMSVLLSPTGHLTNLSTAPANVDEGVHTVPMFPAASDPLGRQGFVRVINQSASPGEVTISAFDDTDRDFGTSQLELDGNQTAHFNSDDLEMGNVAKGLTGGTGAGDGDWRLELVSNLDIEVLAYIRTTNDGFLTAMHDTVPREGDRHRVAIFNPGANVNQASMLRLVNAGDETAEVMVTGIDGNGERSSASVSVSVPPGRSRTLTAQELEAGGDGIEGQLGDGAGKWQLLVESEQPVMVMSLLSSPTGHLTNLSTAPALDFAPADRMVFSDRFVGNRVLRDDSESYVDFLADGRFRKSEGGDTYEGDYTYTHTTRNQATVVFDYDDGDRCTFELTFRSRTAGRLSSTCDDGDSGELGWRLVETPAAHGPASPDLVVQSPSASDTAPHPGSTLTLSVTVRNQGRGRAPATTLHYYRSADATISQADTEVGTDQVVELDASGTTDESIDLAAPQDPGTYYYGACVNGVTAESDAGNNCSTSVAVTVVHGGGSGPPDLVVESPSVSASDLEPGASFTLSATVRNAGDGDAAATTLRYYRSVDDGISADDGEVGSAVVAGLTVSESTGWTIDLRAPEDAGTYHYGACVDGVTGESDASNNCSTGVAVYVTDGGAREGEDFYLDPQNNWPAGIAYASQRFYVANDFGNKVFAYRTNGERDAASDFDLDADNGDPERIVQAGGRFYIVDDRDDKVYAYATDGQPDADADFDLHADNGRARGIAYADGRIHVLDAGKTVYAYAMDGQRDSAAGFDLGAESSSPMGLAHAAGRYHVVDWHGTVYAYGADGRRDIAAEFDLDDANGWPTGIVGHGGRLYVVDYSDERVYVYNPQGPDLLVEPPSSSDAMPDLGETFTLSARVVNQGMSRSSATTLRYYRSEDDTISAGDSQVGSDSVVALDAGGASAFSVELTAPLSSGDHYYGACIDPVTDELDDHNNCSTAVLVSVPGPDLVVRDPWASDETPDGSSSFTLWVTVRNSGERAASASTLRYYRSTNAAISASDVEIGTQTLRALDADAGSRESISLTAPSSKGAYYYGACVDRVAGEPEGGSNCTASGVRVDVGDDGAEAFDLSAANRGATGIAYANQGFYVTDRLTDKVYAYDRDGERESGRDFDLGRAGNTNASDIVFADGRFLVADNFHDKVFAYGSNGRREPSSDFNVDYLNDVAMGIAHDEGGFFVLDGTDDKVYGYGGDGTRDPASDFDLDAANDAADGLAYVRDRFYVGDFVDDKVYAYWSNGQRDATSDVDLHADNGLVRGIAHANGMLYVLDQADEEVYAYSLPAEPDGPDLVVDPATTSDGTLEAGASFDLGITVHNRGVRDSPAATLRYYRSTDALISSADTELERQSVSGLSPSASTARSITLAAPEEDHCYFCGACVDEVEDESANANNCSRPVEILVGERPDLDITRIRDNLGLIVFEGSAIRLTVTVQNRGDGVSRPAKLRFSNGTEAEIPSLAPDESTTVEDHRVGTVRRGYFTFSVCASDVPCERKTDNNCGVHTVNIRASRMVVGTPAGSRQ